MPQNKRTAAEPPTVTEWAGSPIEMAAWMTQVGVDLPTELDSSPKMLLKRGVDVGRYGLPQHYNKLHFLARTAFIATGEPPLYEFLNPPPGAADWALMQSNALAALNTHLATETSRVRRGFRHRESISKT